MLPSEINLRVALQSRPLKQASTSPPENHVEKTEQTLGNPFKPISGHKERPPNVDAASEEQDHQDATARLPSHVKHI